jgi:hypothetical protein
VSARIGRCIGPNGERGATPEEDFLSIPVVCDQCSSASMIRYVFRAYGAVIGQRWPDSSLCSPPGENRRKPDHSDKLQIQVTGSKNTTHPQYPQTHFTHSPLCWSLRVTENMQLAATQLSPLHVCITFSPHYRFTLHSCTVAAFAS